MKVKKEYGILLGIIILLAIYLIFSSGRNKMSYSIPQLDRLPEEAVDRIEFTHAGEKTVVSQEEGKWKIMPQTYPADPVKVKDMLEVIQNLILTELAAEKGDYQRYHLDEENKIVVQAYKGDSLVREFAIGKTSSTYSHTFILLVEDSRVFHARGSFRSKFEHKVEDLRDKVVLTFDKNEVTEVRGTKDGSDFLFEKKAVPIVPAAEEEKEEMTEKAVEAVEEEAWVTPAGQKGKKSDIDSIVSQMSSLRCEEFYEGKNKEDFKGPIYVITIKGIKEYTLSIFPKEGEEETRYPAISTENPYPFLLSTYRAESIMKEPADLLENREEE